MKAKGRILVVRGGAIGDFIVTLPVLAALRGQFPDTHLEVLGYPRIAELALAGGLVDAVRSIESRAFAGFFARGGPLDKGLEDYFAGFSIIVSFLYDPDEFFQANVKRNSSAHFIAGPHRPDETKPIHACEVFLKPLERLAIFGADPVPRLCVEQVHTQPSAGLTVAAHPGSGSERKNWPVWRWRDFLLQLLNRKNVRVLLVGGEAESVRLKQLAGDLPAARIELLESRPLPELAARLTACDAFVGHDSGITHLAAAVGLPGIVLWGESATSVWRPQSPRMILLGDSTGLSGVQVESVMERLGEVLQAASGPA